MGMLDRVNMGSEMSFGFLPSMAEKDFDVLSRGF